MQPTTYFWVTGPTPPLVTGTITEGYYLEGLDFCLLFKGTTVTCTGNQGLHFILFLRHKWNFQYNRNMLQVIALQPTQILSKLYIYIGSHKFATPRAITRKKMFINDIHYSLNNCKPHYLRQLCKQQPPWKQNCVFVSLLSCWSCLAG
jgi:hypothetical protein